jgi:hypothetical protein
LVEVLDNISLDQPSEPWLETGNRRVPMIVADEAKFILLDAVGSSSASSMGDCRQEYAAATLFSYHTSPIHQWIAPAGGMLSLVQSCQARRSSVRAM